MVCLHRDMQTMGSIAARSKQPAMRTTTICQSITPPESLHKSGGGTNVLIWTQCPVRYTFLISLPTIMQASWCRAISG